MTRHYKTIAILALVPGLAIAAQPRPPVREPGVVVRLFDIGAPMRQIPKIAPGQSPNLIRFATTVDLQTARGGFGSLVDGFVTEVSGFVTVSRPGVYIFQLISDDGSKLWLDGDLLIDHDGLHGATPKDAAIKLIAGEHPFRIVHFEAGGDERLTLMWKTPDADDGVFAVVPPSALSHDPRLSHATSGGKKRIVLPLRRGRPGDGTPTDGLHPSFELSRDPHPAATLIATVRAAIDGQSCTASTGELIKAKSSRRVEDGAMLLNINKEHPDAAQLLSWLPPDTLANQPTTPCVLRGGGFRGQLLVGDGASGSIHRVFIDRFGEIMQGCVFRFADGAPDQVHALVADPAKDILVATSEFAGESPVLHRLRPTGKLPFEMLAVRMMTNGLEITFTHPLDPRVGWDPESYLVEHWPWGLSAGDRRPTRDGTSLTVKSASVSTDRRRVFLEIEGIRKRRLVYLRLLPPCLSERGELPRTTEAWYTLLAIPRDRYAEVLTPPARNPQNILTDAQRSGGWRLLFDGTTTDGWRGFRKQAMPVGWQAVDDCLVRVGPGGDIITTGQFDSFELAIEWRISPGGNSGIFFRVTEDGDYVWRTGPEMQVLDNGQHADGRNPLTSAGANYALHAPIRDVTEPIGLFNKARLVVEGNHVEHWLNGVKIVEYELLSDEWEALVANSKFKTMPNCGRMNKGHIALQDHGDKVWYRNIKIRPLKVR